MKRPKHKQRKWDAAQRSKAARILRAVCNHEKKSDIAKREGVELSFVYGVTQRSFDRVASTLARLHREDRRTWQWHKEYHAEIRARYACPNPLYDQYRHRRAKIAVMRRKGATYVAIAKELGISPVRVQQIHQQTERRVRHRVRNAKALLAEPDDDFVYHPPKKFATLDDAVNDWLANPPQKNF